MGPCSSMLQHLILPSSTTAKTTTTVVATNNRSSRRPLAAPTNATILPTAIATDETIPRDNQHAQNPRHATKYERHDAARREARGEPGGRSRLARQIEEVGGVAGGIADGGGWAGAGGGAGGVVVGGDVEGLLLEGQGGFDEGCCET